MVLSNTQGALMYLRDGAKQHPNRRDICTQASTANGIDGPFSRQNRRNHLRNQQRQNPEQPPRNPGFAPPAAPTQPSSFGPSAGFGTNQPQQLLSFGSGFGQPQPPAGLKPTPQQNQASGFGQPSIQSGFGQAQPIGSMANGANPSMMGTGFGQPAAPQQSMNGGFGRNMNGTGFGEGFGQQQPQQPQPNGAFAPPQPQSQFSFAPFFLYTF